jgi:uncharacterized membrane protein YphA (DoxX/SURF4 family)
MSKFEKLQPWIGLVCRLTLGGVLFVAGFLKVDKLEVSQMAVRSYELLPIPIANFLGQTLPFFEVVIGLLLILGAATRAVAALGGFTMFIFIIAIGQAWARGLNIDCGRYLQEILRDAGLVAMALFLLRYPVSKFSVDKAPKQSNAGDTE